ncbi:hypothetical protein MKW92_018751 [Papaver armeniacum]|nr:hypothetical protein MKW92_018751 [Papaver armeniacum]
MTVPGSQNRGTTTRVRSRNNRAENSVPKKVPLRKIFRVASMGCGIQFGWALQLSLLTPYVQELGIPHAFASLVWLCGPLSGFLVQPLVGHMSDRCTSRFGRRKPFIVAGAISIILAVLVIGHSADIGGLLGDTNQSRPRAIIAFVLGFWLLDVANNMTQGPCRALLADLTGKDQRRSRIANAHFSLFMAVGNILGFATGSYSGCVNCANLKSAFFLDIAFMVITTYVSISAAQEVPLPSNISTNSENERPDLSDSVHEPFIGELFHTFTYLTGPIWIILLVTSLTWVGWFPFLLFDTDWMGREIYKGIPNEGQNYHTGVSMGAFGLMLNSVVIGVTSVVMEKVCKKWGGGFVWGVSNILMSFCFVAMLIISFVAKNMDFSAHDLPPAGIVISSLVVFTILGAPLAVTYSVPYAMIATRTEALGLGQGLSMGVLNIAIVIPQVIVSLGSGPWDQLFGGGNSPAFAVGAIAAFASGLVAILALPRSYTGKPRIIHV